MVFQYRLRAVANVKKFLIVIISIISFILICCLLIFFLLKPRDKVSYDIEKWKNLENKQPFLPSVDELGEYTDLKCKFFHKDLFIFESDAYVLRVTYGDEAFGQQKDYINDHYVMQEKVMENGLERETFFTLDGFYFQMLSQKEYKLYYPRTMAFIGISEENNEIAYVFYHDIDLDYIGGSLSDFLIEECGWE